MRKALNVMAWLGLIVCLMWATSLSGQRNVLNREWKDALRKNETLEKKADEAREQAEEAREENEQLRQEQEEWAAALEKALLDLEERNSAFAALEQQLADMEEEARLAAEQQVSDALNAAQAQWDAQRAALTEEKDAAQQRLAEVLSVLMPAAEEEAAPVWEAEEPSIQDSLDDAFAPEG